MGAREVPVKRVRLRPRGVPCTLPVLAALILGPAPALAQNVVADPDAQAQIGLFSAWLDGQIAIRGLPAFSDRVRE